MLANCTELNAEKNNQQIYIFVNPASGNQKANILLNYEDKHIVLNNNDIYIGDITEGTSGAIPIIQELSKSMLQNNNTLNQKYLVVVMGGDGTVIWVIEELINHKIDTSRINLCVLPFGTGNDFAKAFGWTIVEFTNSHTKNIEKFKKLVSSWQSAEVVNHDIWYTKITKHTESDYNGTICKIDSKTRKKIEMNTDTLTKLLSNYFSIGQESRIGIGFDRHRRSSRFLNKLVYFYEGLKKFFFHRKRYINDDIKYLAKQERTSGLEEIIFKANESINIGITDILKPSISLVAINIPSFAGGLNIWKHSQKIGIKQSSKILLNNEMKQSNLNDSIQVKVESKCCCSHRYIKQPVYYDEILKEQQITGDKKIEWMSFKGISSIGYENIKPGHARRLYTGTGDFILKFQRLNKNKRIYFQIDGEYYQITCPQQISISHYTTIKCLKHSESKYV